MTTPGESRQVYVQRVNAVMDYVDQNLSGDLSIEVLAAESLFSAYHFHRIFRALTGEPLASFVRRLRTERAATMLIFNSGMPITEIAMSCGFSTPSTLARSFKERFGCSPSQWRQLKLSERDHRVGRVAPPLWDGSRLVQPGTEIWLDPAASNRWLVDSDVIGSGEIQIVRRETTRVAYVRHVGPFQGSGEVFRSLFGRLEAWAATHRARSDDSETLALYHDNPSLTEDEQLRVSACLSLAPNISISGEVGETEVAGGMYACGLFTLGEEDYAEAWNCLLAGWLPQSGFEPDDRYHFERFPAATSTGDKIPVEIHIPVRRLIRR